MKQHKQTIQLFTHVKSQYSYVPPRMATKAKQETVDAIADELGFTKKDTAAFYDAFVRHMLDNLRDGHKVFMRGFGSFEVFVRQATRRRNPLTGEIIEVPEKKAIRFNTGRLLADALEG